MPIERTELMTNVDKIAWLKVLSDGYAKPDLSENPTGTGTVRETKNYMPWIMSINKHLCEASGIECPELPDEFTQFRNNKRSY